MLRSGLVSVTFRQLSPREIVDLCAAVKLDAIEWGGDVHVPPGGLETAREIGKMTREAGLEVACYGSYYRCGGDAPFESVLETAVALNAPLIRVWAGGKDFEKASQDEKNEIARNLERALELAQAAGIALATEFHGGTLTNSAASVMKLQQELRHAALFSLWQPLLRGPNDPKTAENVGELETVLPFLSNVHVYNWSETAKGRERLPLFQSTDWPKYLEVLKKDGADRFLLLEFVPGDDPALLKREAATLRDLIAANPSRAVASGS